MPRSKARSTALSFMPLKCSSKDLFSKKPDLPLSAPLRFLHFFLLRGFEFSAFKFLRLFIVALAVFGLFLRLRDSKAAQAD